MSETVDMTPFYADYVREWNSIPLDSTNDSLSEYASFSAWAPAVDSGTTNPLISTARCGSQKTDTTVQVLLITSFVFNTDGGALNKVVLSGLPFDAESGTVYSVNCLVIKDNQTSPVVMPGSLTVDPGTSVSNLEIVSDMDFVEDETYYVKGILSYQTSA